MKTVMVLAGGTSTAWHIASELKAHFHKEIRLIICDVNPPYLVHTSVLADKYLQVPPIKSSCYYNVMLENIKTEQVDLLIPLIDDDIVLFASDNPDLQLYQVTSTAPSRNCIDFLGNKRNLSEKLEQIGINVPHVFRTPEELDQTKTYFVKDMIGCGSKGARLVCASEAVRMLEHENKVVQEVCIPPEITVDVVRDGTQIHTICRERLEIKLGVSTKCRVFWDYDIQNILEKVAKNVELPFISCVQFMKNLEGEWVLIDFNLRSGGGTALSAAIGFQAVRFAAAHWLHLPAYYDWLVVPETDQYVVRTYHEIVTK